MRWRKGGRIYVPDGSMEWARSHAAYPTPLVLPWGDLRLYLAFRNDRNVGSIGYIDVDPEDPRRVLNVSQTPALSPGLPGSFDCNGMGPSSLVVENGLVRLYYFGFGPSADGPFRLLTGLATCRNGDTRLQRTSPAPILAPIPGEGTLRSAPFVLHEDDLWMMWYASGDGWVNAEGRQLPTCAIHFTTSQDGVLWSEPTTSCLRPAGSDEYQVGKPWVVHEHGLFHMIYSIRMRSKGFRLGYARSIDGRTWERRDEEVGIGVSASGWDSEMISYGAVHRSGNRCYLFYNGNGLGAGGVGFATMEDGFVQG